ncbi:hypothetical protein ACOSP7_024669 [Xanthoceras sorbifolium]
MVWRNWFRRNKLMYEQVLLLAIDTVVWSLYFLNDKDDANVRPAAPLGTAVSIGWKAPDEGWFKLNVDTSLRATDCLVGLWAVIHDSNGAFMADLSRKLIGLVSIEAAEAFAISNGLYLAFESSFSWLQVESGTLNVINYIIQNNSP